MKFKTILFGSLLFIGFSCTKEENKTIKEMDPIAVVADELTAGDYAQSLFATGKLEAKNNAKISTRMMGFVNTIPVKTGQEVQKGDLLATIQSTDLSAQKAQAKAGISQAEANFKNAEKDLKRYQSLYDKNSATQKELDDMQTRFEAASAQLETAKAAKSEVNAHLSYAELKAPFSGVVTAIHLKEGDMANPGMPVLSIENPEQLEAVVMVSERDILNIDLETSATIYLKSVDKSVKGKVSEISRSSSQSAGQYLVKIEVEPTEQDVLSGMIVNVSFDQENKENQLTAPQLLIPETALISKGQLSGVYVINEDNTALLRWLRIGKKVENQVEVLSGLSIGEKYVVEANSRLFNGSKVSLE